jgi:hypothetical protein
MRTEVENALAFITDSLKAAEVPYEAEVSDENPDVMVVCAADKQGYENVGLVGWSEDKGAVYYAAYNPVVGIHDEMELVPEEDSRCWFAPPTAEMFVWHLTGKIRAIVAEVRELEKA